MTRAEQVEQRAADWLMRTEEPGWGPDDQRLLEDWLAESIAHKAAFWRLRHGWREADRIVALGPASAGVRHRAPIWQWAIAASLLLTTGVGWLSWSRSSDDKVAVAGFVTPVGGHRIVKLADHSVIELNTATAVRVAITSHHREVWLERGEAYFQVAHLRGEPFVVHAGQRSVTVLGTKFSVRNDIDKTTVSVVDGRVGVGKATGSVVVPNAILTAGDVAVAQGRSTLLTTLSPDRMRAQLAWRSGKLEFDETPLADAAREFNRYNRVQIIIHDEETGSIKISGTFQTSNVEAFVRLLRAAYGLKVETSQGSMIIAG
ncbi:MAG TPA: FecR domain-containing protein [Sphingomicrobium sp.]|nr:FecR domain-containing protein [Sphingomicrobium sp.]